MDAAFYLVQFLTGLANAASLFLMASGLSLIFGVTRIVNFAHGGFYMMGAYLGVSLVPLLSPLLGGIVGFWTAIVLAALGAGLIGLLFEILILRRIYGTYPLFQLLATFGFVLILEDGVVWIWGPDTILGQQAPLLESAVAWGGYYIPSYDLFLIALSGVVLIGLWVLLHRSRLGLLIRASRDDKDMAAALGINQAYLFSAVVFLGCLLAGLAGVLQTPREPANAFMAQNIIAEAFVVTVIGGMGNPFGAFLAAFLIGELEAFGILIWPEGTLFLTFALMGIVLVFRPQGLLGKSSQLPGEEEAQFLLPAPKIALPLSLKYFAFAAMAVVFCILPFITDDYLLGVFTEALIFSLLALSIHLLLGQGGLISFGHAAFFGLGGYASALLFLRLHVPLEMAILLGALASAFFGLITGALLLRLSGIYLAMLTLAFAQLLWGVSVQWVSLTGGDNGLVGLWPPQYLASTSAYYYFSLVIVAVIILLIWRQHASPHGFAMRALRDSSRRARAIDMPVSRVRLLAFSLSGGIAGLAGALFIFLKGVADPYILSIETSLEGLLMVLIGGVRPFAGPIAGAFIYTFLKAWFIPYVAYWKAGIGAIILGLIVLMPEGVLLSGRGLIARLAGTLRKKAALWGLYR